MASAELASAEKCRLCDGPGPLRDSHLTPKFVIEWMRRTGSRYLRSPATPNKRKQDGPKLRLLCSDCEQRFSSDENAFATHIFHAYMDDPSRSFDYGPELYFFLLSILWRSLVAKEAHFESSFAWSGRLQEVDRAWKRALLERRAPEAYADIHLVLMAMTDGSPIPVVNFNAYFSRTIDMTIGSSPTTCYVYAKFARYIVVSPITPIPDELMVNTRVFPDGGRMEIPQAMRDGDLGAFILDRARQFREKMTRGMSPRQQALINETAKKDWPRLRKSDLGAVLAADFGSAVEPVLARKIGRNELCPCGRVIKFKRCHGR
jgi:hypothetical protein